LSEGGDFLVGIIIGENEPIDRALRRFKKKYERSGILKEVKKRAFFTKPSVKKRMKKAKAIRRTIRAASEEL
jgi:small subunit ribosomal protein S21